MNLILVFLLNLLSFSNCLAANINQKSSGAEFVQPNQRKNQNEVDLLTEDFLYQMFDDADLEQILQFVKNPRYSDFVKRIIFPVKYQECLFNIIATDSNNREPEALPVSSKCLCIYGHDFYLDIIKHFGEQIQKVAILSTDLISDERSAIIHRYLNEYCSESLIDLHMESIKGSTLAQFKKPFSKLEYLYAYIGTDQAGSILPFKYLFPRLHRIFLSYTDYDVSDELSNATRFIESEVPHMEHLKHLEISISLLNRTHRATVYKQIENIFRRNPQIRILTHTPKLGDFIHVINEFLPHLEEFRIWELEYNGERLQFDNVRKFTVCKDYESHFEKLFFPRLEKLGMSYSSLYKTESARNSWIEFLKNHQNLRELNCTFFSSEGLVELLAELPNLVEIRTKSYKNFEIDLISGLIEDHTHLLRFEYQINAYIHRDRPDLTSYREKFGNDWHISHCFDGDWSIITFEKEN